MLTASPSSETLAGWIVSEKQAYQQHEAVGIPMGRIFISHRNTPADNAWAAKVHAWIKDQKGIRGFLDFDVEDGIKSGEEWEMKIYASMNAAQVVIAIVSKDWLASDWCISEARMARLLGRKLLLIITEECTVPFRDTQSIRFDKHGDEAIVFKELRQALSTTHKLPERPYPGLATFEEKDAAVFFGRGNESRELVNRVNSLFQGRPQTPRILLVQGASGSGKSSLMRAGFLSEFRTDPKSLCVGPIIPRGDALDEFAEALDTPLDECDPDAAADAVIASLKRANPAYERAVICVDQAEELLEESGAFFDVMRALLEKRRGRVIVLATIRSDFLNEFQTRRLIGEEAELKYATIELDPLPKDHLSAIIREPARLFGVEYDDALFGKICEDHGGPDALPLLAFFLNKFWQDRYVSDGVLQLSEYKDFGGINQALKGAVAEAVESCMAVEPAQKDQQKILQELREVFLGHLVAVNAGSDSAVRRRAPAEGLTARQVALLKVFSAQRLLLEDKGEWEVAHEALLRQWQDLRNWIDAAREDLVAINRIEAAAAQWDREGRRDEDLTHSGSRLEDGFRMRNSPRYAERFDATAKAYLEACRQKEDDRFEKEKSLREAAERGKFEAEAAARQALKNQRLGLVAMSSSELQAGHPAEAVHLALAAWPRRPDSRDSLSDYSVVLDTLTKAGLEQREVCRIMLKKASWYEQHKSVRFAFSPNGTRLVRWCDGGTLQLWDAVNGVPVRVPMEGHAEDVSCVAFSPDGTRFVSGSEDNTLRLWDARTGDEIRTYSTGHEEGVSTVAFSPDGAQFLTGSFDGKLRLWDARSGDSTGNLIAGHENRAHVDMVLGVAFLPDGSRFISWCAAGTVRLWGVEARNAIGALFKRSGSIRLLQRGRCGSISTAALSPDRSWIACVSKASTGGDFEDAKQIMTLLKFTGQNDEVGTYLESKNFYPENMRWTEETDFSCAAFSADGARVVSVRRDGAFQLWDAASCEPIGELITGPAENISSVAVSPDASRIVSGSKDGTLRLWDVQTGQWIGSPMTGHGNEIRHVAFSQDGARVASEGRDGTIRLWDVKAGNPIGTPMAGHTHEIGSVAFSPDGTRVVSGSEDGTLRLWDARICASIGSPLEGHDGPVRGVAFSPDGTRIASVGRDRTIRQWDAHSGEPIGAHIEVDLPWEYYDETTARVAFTSDGARIIYIGLQGSLGIWDARTAAWITPMNEHEEWNGRVRRSGALFSDGSWVVAADQEGLLRLWDVQGDIGTPCGPPIEGTESISILVAVSPDGTRLVNVPESNALQLWDPFTGIPIGPPMVMHGNVSCIAISPDGTQLVSGDFDKIHLWDLATCRELARIRASGPVNAVAFSPDGKRIVSSHRVGTSHYEGGGYQYVVSLWDVDYGPGNLFEVLCRRLPTRDPPAILETYGIVLDEPICSGEEPLPFQTDGTP